RELELGRRAFGLALDAELRLALRLRRDLDVSARRQAVGPGLRCRERGDSSEDRDEQEAHVTHANSPYQGAGRPEPAPADSRGIEQRDESKLPTKSGRVAILRQVSGHSLSLCGRRFTSPRLGCHTERRQVALTTA